MVVLRPLGYGFVHVPGEEVETFEMGGHTYAVDPVSRVRVMDPFDSFLESSVRAGELERPEVRLRQALRECVAAGVSDSKIVDIVNLELVYGVMEL